MDRETRSDGVKGPRSGSDPTQPWPPLVLRVPGPESENRESKSALSPLLSKGTLGLLSSLGFPFTSIRWES